jgi:cellulose synthase/poly-beta-1,6-N-acetylglucosamine synthase-like glycosyltransferase
VSLRAKAFWASAAGAGWVLAGYPLSLTALRERPWRSEAADADLPSVTIVVPGYRERETLPPKVRALDELEYPADKVEVLVAIDGDEELARLAAEAAPRARVLFSDERGGKAAGLNRALDRASGDVIVMTDANNLLEPGSLRAALRHFADPAIWAVAGRRGESGSAYDRYEDLIRRLESRSGSVAAMSGEFMAVRREHAPRFPEDVVNDDFWLLCHLIRGGGRVIYEPDAASEEPPPSAKGEVARRTRMSAGRVMAAGELAGLPAGFALRVISHKLGRLVLPFLLFGALLASLTLGRRRGYRVLALAQCAAYGAGALASAGVAPPGPAGRVARALGQFTLGNAAIGLGVIRALRKRQSVVWDPVD